MAEARCAACEAPVDGATICQGCTDQLAADLRAVPGLVDDLHAALARQTVLGSHAGGGRSAVKPLPYDPRAGEVLRLLGSTLGAWSAAVRLHLVVGPSCRRCEHPSCLETPARMVGADLKWLATRLRLRLDDLRQLPDAGDALDEIGHACVKARQAVDRRPDRWYAGPCGKETDDEGTCAVELYARPNAATITCRGCRTVWDVAERRKWLLAAAEDYLLPLAEIARAVPRMLGQALPLSTLTTWKHRGQLVPKGRAPGRDGRLVDLFRVGDVIDRAHSRKKRGAES